MTSYLYFLLHSHYECPYNHLCNKRNIDLQIEKVSRLALFSNFTYIINKQTMYLSLLGFY